MSIALRNRAMHVQDYHVEAPSRLMHNDPSTDATIATVLKLIVDQLGLRTSFVAMIEDLDDRLHVMAAYNAAGGCDVQAPAVVALPQIMHGMLGRSGSSMPVVIEDTANDRDWVAQPGIRSLIAVPIILADGTIFGTLCAADPQPRSITAVQVDLLVILTRLMATELTRHRETIARQQAEQELHESEDLYRSLVEISPDAIAVLAEGRILFTNTSGAHILGVADSKLLINRSIFEFAAPESAPNIENLVRQMSEGQIVPPQELTLIRRDGLSIAIEIAARPITFKGQPGGLIIARDITERKHVQRRLESQAQLLELAHESILVLDPTSRRITYWNRGAEELYGWPASETIGQISDELLQTHFPIGRSAVELALEQNGRWEGELEQARRDGTRFWVSSRSALRRSKAGKPTAILEMNRDVTKRKAVEAKLKGSLTKQRAINEQLERISATKSRFVSIVSHEFRTALTGIQGFSEMMRDEELSMAELKEFALDINEDAKRLNRMITDMLDIDRMEAGRMALHRDRVDLNCLIIDEAAEVSKTASHHPIELQLSPNLPPVSADRDKLIQVLTNLLSNAVKYSPDGGRITITSQFDTTCAHVTIADQGAGIPVAALDKIFERYHRVESTTSRYIQGTGLGLPIVRQIVDLHGGKVWAESIPDQGSTFHFTLPLAEVVSP
ncbi:MAG: hypothetical protein NVSMB42_21750 [Herpetosiphon sp.]